MALYLHVCLVEPRLENLARLARPATDIALTFGEALDGPNGSSVQLMCTAKKLRISRVSHAASFPYDHDMCIAKQRTCGNASLAVRHRTHNSQGACDMTCDCKLTSISAQELPAKNQANA